MHSFNPFTSVTGRNSFTLFEIRLENDFIVLRGGEHESAGQLLKGTVVLCLPTALKVEDIHLRLTGVLRLSWADPRITASGATNQKTDRAFTLLENKWSPFVGGQGKSVTLPAGNYEWPFEYTVPGTTPESVEGIPEASITYRLKATITRGKFAYDLHSYKPVRIIRTLEPGALEFLHAMSVENIWPNKIEYSIIIPQKAIVFGTSVPIEMRFTPLLKGLELGEISAKLVEYREVSLVGTTGLVLRERRTERDIASWKFEVTREEHWHDMISDTGQEGWTVEHKFGLPKKLRQCVQDLHHNGIKIRHKIKLTVALKNPDGHISELRATLPVSIFISPNMPFDEEGNLVSQTPGVASAGGVINGSIAPPGYGEHVLDQLFEDIDMSGFQTPAFQSGISSPYLSTAQSRAGSEENLNGAGPADGITAAALSSRLQTVELLPSQRNSSIISLSSVSSQSARSSQLNSSPLSRSSSAESHSGRTSPEQLDLAELGELSKVPSYATAVRTPATSRAFSGGVMLPDYESATAPTTPAASDTSDPLSTIHEVPTAETMGRALSADRLLPRTSRPRPSSMSSLMLQRTNSSERRRSHLVLV